MRRLALIAAAIAAPAAAADTVPVAEQPANSLQLGASYTLDLTLTSEGSGRLHRLDRLDFTCEARLERIGWSGARAFIRLLGNSGMRPNDRAGTLQGVNNIEVPSGGLRLFEAWLEQDFGRGSLRVGAYDLNSEFYATESSTLLLGPEFGIGSELAATGPNGPAIFPYSALAVRGEAKIAGQGVLRAALVSARAGTLTDAGGMDVSLREGVLGIVEGGFDGPRGRVMIGTWAYSRRQPRHHPAMAGERRTMGTYLLIEKPVSERVSGFLRAGFSDGRTSSFRGGWQLGLQAKPAPGGGSGSAMAIGLHQAFLSRGERSMITLDGRLPARSEAGVELTWRDRLLGPVTVQPSLQLIRHPGGLADRSPLVVGTVRLAWEL